MYDSYSRHDSASIEYKREFTEAQFYRALSQFYDQVEEEKATKRLRTAGFALASNGFTHLIAALATTFPDYPFASSEQMTMFYCLLAVGALISGIVILAAYGLLCKRSAPKEKLIRKFISHEFAGTGLRQEYLDDFDDF